MINITNMIPISLNKEKKWTRVNRNNPSERSIIRKFQEKHWTKWKKHTWIKRE